MKSMQLAVGLILLFLAVPVQAQTMTAAQKADIEKAVKEKVTQLYSVLDTLSPEAYVKLWSQDKIIGALGATGLEKSFEAMAKGIQGYRDASKSRTTESVDILAVQVVSPEMAIAFSKTTFKAELNNGNINYIIMGNTTIWVKESEAWKLAFFAGTAAAKPQTQADVEQDLIKLEKDWGNAIIKRDVAFLDRIMANESVGTDYKGIVHTSKAEYLADVKSGATAVTSLVVDDMKAHVWGNAGIVWGRTTEKSRYKGKNTSGQYQWTDTWIKQSGRWQCVASHSSKVVKK